MKTKELAVLALLTLGAGGILLAFAFVDKSLRSSTSAVPQEITLADLAAYGPGQNRHVCVTDVAFGHSYIYEKEKTWNHVFMPLVSPDGRIKVVVKSEHLKSPEEVDQFAEQESITGVYVEHLHLSDREMNIFRQYYPDADLHSLALLNDREIVPTDSELAVMFGAPLVPFVAALVFGFLFVRSMMDLPEDACADEPPNYELPEGLGEYQRSFSADARSRSMIGFGAGLFCIVVGIAPASFIHTFPRDRYLAASLLGLGAIGLVVLFLGGLWRRGRRIRLFEYGLIVERRWHHTACRWEDVTALKGMFRMIFRGREVYFGNMLTLTLQNGTSLVLGPDVEDQCDLADVVYRKTSHLMVGGLLALRRGEMVTFGSLRVDRDGIVVGWELLPWKGTEVRLSSGSLLIFRADAAKPAFKQPVAMTPNIAVFMEAVRVFQAEAYGSLPDPPAAPELPHRQQIRSQEFRTDRPSDRM